VNDSGASSESTADSRQPPIRLVVIVGSGRCGSTILDILLGSDPRVQSTGELMKLASPDGAADAPCSCGESSGTCPFWSSVRSSLPAGTTLGELRQGRTRYELIRDLPFSLPDVWFRRDGVVGHGRRMATLVRTIAAAGGRSIIVDSSKDPARGLLYSLLRDEGIDVRYIHVVRDGRGFVYSKKAHPDGSGLRRTVISKRRTSALVAQWLGVNLLCSVLFARRASPYLRIRYEDLVAEPAAVLRQVGAFIGLDLSETIARVQNGEPVAISHLIGGNRLRFGASVVLRPDVEWKDKLSVGDKRMFWRLAGWLASAYGYRSERAGARAAAPE